LWLKKEHLQSPLSWWLKISFHRHEEEAEPRITPKDANGRRRILKGDKAGRDRRLAGPTYPPHGGANDSQRDCRVMIVGFLNFEF
jgi:hypothetical protein